MGEVTALKYRQGGKSKGWRATRVEGGMVHPPMGGWGEKEYMIFTTGDLLVHKISINAVFNEFCDCK